MYCLTFVVIFGCLTTNHKVIMVTTTTYHNNMVSMHCSTILAIALCTLRYRYCFNDLEKCNCKLSKRTIEYLTNNSSLSPHTYTTPSSSSFTDTSHFPSPYQNFRLTQYHHHLNIVSLQKKEIIL